MANHMKEITYTLAIGFIVLPLLFNLMGMVTGIIHWNSSGDKKPFITNFILFTVGLILFIYY